MSNIKQPEATISNVAAQYKDTNLITKKPTTKHKDTQNKQDSKQTSSINSSNVSITSSNSSKIIQKQQLKDSTTSLNKPIDSKKTKKSSSRPSSKNENKDKVNEIKTNLNQSTQSIQGRPDSTKSSTRITESSASNEVISKGEDSTTNSILSLNSTSLGAVQSGSVISDQFTSKSELESASINQSQTSISSSSNTNKTTGMPIQSSKTPADKVDSVTTSVTSINSQTASSSNTSGIVTSSPIRRRKKPPAPKPPININNQQQQQQQRASNVSLSHHSNCYASSNHVPINTSTCCNLALSHSNCSLVTTYTNTCSSLSTVNLTNTTTSTNNSSADINSLTRRKKYKKKPAPPIPIKSQQIYQQQDKRAESKLSNNEISLTAVSSSCSKQLVNKRALNGSSRLTPHKTPCTSGNHRNKSNVKQRINRILARSLSEAYRLNAKTALNSVQHSFSSEVSLNKRNLNTMINNTAFTDSFNSGHHQQNEQHINKAYTPEQSKKIKKPDDLNKKNDDKKINEYKSANKLEPNSDQNDLVLSPFTCSKIDKSYINSNRLVNQLFKTQPNQNFQPLRRCSSLPYFIFRTVNKYDRKKERNNLKNLSNQSKTSRKRTSAYNVANDLIIETLSNNLYNGSADQLLYAAELLEEFSENVVAVPSLSSQLAGLLSPQHYQKHNLNNQLLLINHYMDCLKHEQEQEELLTVQLIEQQQVNRMRIEINKEQELNQLNNKEVVSADKKPETSKENEVKTDLIDKKVIPINKTPSLAKKTPTAAKKEPTTLSVNGHESTQSEGELHSDTSDGKVTVKCMPTNRFQESQCNATLLTSVATSKRQKDVSSSGLSLSSSSKTLLGDKDQEKDSKKHKQSLEHLDHGNFKGSNYCSLNRNVKHRQRTCCLNKQNANDNYCLMYSQSSNCLNEHCHHQHHLNEESSSSSSSQSTRSTEDLNWSSNKNRFAGCTQSIGLKQFSINSHQAHQNSHSLYHSNYLNTIISSSECSTDDSCSVDSPMRHNPHKSAHSLHLLHHHQPHSNSFNSLNAISDNSLVCACCEQHQTNAHLFKSGQIPNSAAAASYLNDLNTYSFEPGKQNYNYSSSNKTSNVYDCHNLQLDDMFNSESSALLNQELTELMEQLQIAISCGKHKKAALLAREAALRKCTLQQQQQSNVSAQPIVVYLYIEDLNNHVQGPISMQLYPTMTVRELKLKMHKDFGFDVSMQKWILGNSLASNDDKTLFTYGITCSGCPIFLYLFDSKELYDYHHEHQFLTDSLPSLVELNEDQISNEDDLNGQKILDKQSDKKLDKSKKLNKKLSASLDTSLSHSSNAQDKGLNRRLDASLDTNLNKNKTLDRRNLKKQKEIKKPKITNLIDEMLDCKFEDDLSEELLPPPISFQSSTSSLAVGTLVDTFAENLEPTNWVNSKLHENFIMKPIKPTRPPKNGKQTSQEEEEFESASEDLVDSIEEDRSIEEIIIEEEVYELESNDKPSTSQNYNDLIKLDDLDLVTNNEPFECSVCLLDVKQNDGVVLKECLHSFCKDCLINCIEHCEQPPVYCPFDNDEYKCKSELSEREIKALLKDDDLNLKKYEQYQKKSLKLASLRPEANSLAFLCRTNDCDGFCYYEANTKWFRCPLCDVLFCLQCKESHNEEQQCKLDEQLEPKELTEEEKKSESFIQEMIEKNQAIPCPKCGVIIIKKWGCQLVKCSMCKTEVCWITRKTRWGPKGKGDTSDGCKCGVNNKKCHPLCDYCH